MSDLIDESAEDLFACGYKTTNLDKFGITCSKLFVEDEKTSKKLGFEKGHYFVLNAPLLSDMMEEHYDILQAEIKYRFKFLLKTNKVRKNSRILFVGIGNPNLIADCFGVYVVKKIEINPYQKNNKIFKIVPNIFANTGFDVYDIVRLLIKSFDISAVLLFDSLVTTNINRLGCSIQFNDAGLTPGSAINNFGKPINKKVLGVPCICVGIPMMINSKSLKIDKDIILTENNIREKVEFLSDLISNVVNDLF